jgi:IS5 family transposase
MKKCFQPISPAYITSLDKLNDVIDWEMFRKPLEESLKYKFHEKGGRPAFDPILMFKIIVIQKYFCLSDEETEFQIKDRLSFMRFLNISMTCAFPDKNTIWVYRERLGEKGIRSMFDLFDKFLHDKGLIGNKGKMVDASFVNIPRPRNTKEENDQIKNGETPVDWNDNPNKVRQKDIDAEWTQKNCEKHMGYKNHAKVDVDKKFINDYTVTPASTHDSQEMPNLAKKGDKIMYADSAYIGQKILNDLKKKKIKPRIIERGARNRPLTDAQKKRNKVKSKTRVRVEHVFGWLTQRGADRIRTIGIRRARFSIGLGNMIYNMSRYVLYA